MNPTDFIVWPKNTGDMENIFFGVSHKKVIQI